MKLISVLHNGKIHRLSELALEILGLERVEHKEKPIEIKKLPPNLEIIKIQKKEVEVPVEVKAVEPVEVKKKEDAVIVESEEKPKRKSRGSKVGIEK